MNESIVLGIGFFYIYILVKLLIEAIRFCFPKPLFGPEHLKNLVSWYVAEDTVTDENGNVIFWPNRVNPLEEQEKNNENK